ncbi:hypothetical protein [Streptomyces sp. AC627_RSS907]|uniref:hypothetical protein n=1 Tax=Streptomyces sp. AC627_RSS907 TaxID=2823684 RepID=UPI001C21C533|nr:hypothetical protein [Streptomyces sp. AC627_RSS907]
MSDRWRLLSRLARAAGRGDAVARHELFSVHGRSVAWVWLSDDTTVFAVRRREGTDGG